MKFKIFFTKIVIKVTDLKNAIFDFTKKFLFNLLLQVENFDSKLIFFLFKMCSLNFCFWAPPFRGETNKQIILCWKYIKFDKWVSYDNFNKQICKIILVKTVIQNFICQIWRIFKTKWPINFSSKERRSEAKVLK